MMTICPTISTANHTLNRNGSSLLFCDTTEDKISCWPATAAGSVAFIPCPEHFDGLLLFPGNATRNCLANGTWQEKSDYSQCLENISTEDTDFHAFVRRIIYYVGFSLSIIALSIALFLFLYFRSLRCLRNTIHCHLLTTFILKHVLYLKMVPTMPILSEATSEAHQVICKLLVTLLHYLQVTNFFWMLIEGLYLHIVLCWAFSHDRLRFWHYAILGWGVPGIFILAWAIVKAKYDTNPCWMEGGNYIYDYIYIIPIFVVLVVNVIFLLTIVWILVTKLRATRSSQNLLYKKAAKATLVLLPLLGISYILLCWVPLHPDFVYLAYVSAILQATQGLFVATIYCFLNVEVQNVVKKHLSRWRDDRQMSMKTQTSIVTQDHSSLHGVSRDGIQTKLKDLNRDDSTLIDISVDRGYVNGLSTADASEKGHLKSTGCFSDEDDGRHGCIEDHHRHHHHHHRNDDDEEHSEQDFTKEDLV